MSQYEKGAIYRSTYRNTITNYEVVSLFVCVDSVALDPANEEDRKTLDNMGNRVNRVTIIREEGTTSTFFWNDNWEFPFETVVVGTISE